MELLSILTSKKTSRSIDKNKTRNTFSNTKTYYFPSLTHKELDLIKNLKHENNYKSRTRKQYNNFKNFHTEVLKTNFKDNQKYSSLFNSSIGQVTNIFKFPDLNEHKNEDNKKIIKMCLDSQTIPVNYFVKNINIKNNTIKNNSYNKTASKKNNMSNISTNANISLSNNSYKILKLNKYTSSSIDFNFNNNNSYLNINKYKNNSKNTLNDNSFEQRIKTHNSNNTSISIANKLNRNYTNINNTFLSKSNSNITSFNDNNNKIFTSNLNPIYALLKKEMLSEFNKKTKNISYLKFILMKKKLDIELEKERTASALEQQNLSNYNLKTLLFFFNRYNDSKFEYFNYLKKTVSEEKEINEKLKEDKITKMNEIYFIRHKTLRLENRFRNYLNDKFFLLSVKNHSFKLNNFTIEDQEDYNKDLKKLEILNIILKLTAKDYPSRENDNNEIIFSKRNNKIRLTKLNNNKTSLFVNFHNNNNINNNINNHINNHINNNSNNNYNNNNISNKNNNNNNNINFIRKSPIKKSFRRQNTKNLANKYYSIYDSKPESPGKKQNIIKTDFKATPLYHDPDDFNKDLQQTTNTIQLSLVEYNKVSKEVQNMKNLLLKTKLEMINIENYQKFIKDEIKIYKKNLDNLKKLNDSLLDYQNYLLNIDVLNLNKGKVNIKIDKIVNKLLNSKDEILVEYLDNLKKKTTLQKLVIIERGIEFLLNYKEIQKQSNNRKFNIIQSKIEDKNRIKLSEYKHEKTRKKLDTIIKKVINKNKKVIFVSRRKVNNGFRPVKQKTKKIKINDLNYYFGNFDID